MQMDGSSFASIGNPASLANLPAGNATFSAWVDLTQTGGVLMGKEDSDESTGWVMSFNYDNTLWFESAYTGDYIELNSTRAAASNGKWSYITVTLAGSPNNGGQATIYINGVPSGTATGTGQSIDDSAQTAYLGNVNWYYPFEGLADEFRISNVVRSQDWITTEFNNQGSPSTFYQLLGENAIGVAPTSAALYASQSEQLAAIAPCASPLVSWSLDPSAPGTLSTAGLYTAPSSIEAQQTVNVTAISQANGSTVGSATLTLFPPVQVGVTPAAITVSAARESRQFTATVTNAKNTSVIWSISPNNLGSIDPYGVYTSPNYLQPNSSNTVTITATSVVDPTQSASATISLVPLTISPSYYSIFGGYSLQFTSNMPVAWTASEGTIDATGLFSAPIELAGTIVSITGTGLDDPKASASINMWILSPPHSVSPAAVSLIGGQTQQFSACMATDATHSQCSPATSAWSISPAGAGSIDANGLYTAPPIVYQQQTVVVTAMDLSNPLISGSAAITLVPPSVSISPQAATLYSGQSEQFFAAVKDVSNTKAVWSISPAGAGSIDATGHYQAPNGILTQQVVTVTASSQAVPSFSASATITLDPTQCLSKDYTNVRSIAIDHNRVANTDQANFPFLFTATDPTFASTSNGGHVTSPNGDDIVFTSDPAGANRLDYEVEQYNALTGQITAWIRIPRLSHTSDTVIYMFYGNPAITASQQNAASVWDSNYQGVYHLANGPSAGDSTGNQNNAQAQGLSSAPGIFDSTAAFDGSTSYLSVPAVESGNYPASGLYTTDYSLSFATWFKTSQEGVIFGQTSGPPTPNGYAGGYIPALYVDDTGLLRAAMFNLVDAQQSVFFGTIGVNYNSAPQLVTTNPYNDNQWHYAALTYNGGTEVLYVDGQVAAAQYSAIQSGYAAGYSYFVGTGAASGWSGTTTNWDFFHGSLQEVELSKTARSGDWFRTQYLNQRSPSTFFTLSPELDGNVAISPLATTLYAGQSQQFAILDATLCGAGGATWSMPDGSPGTLSSAGLYTAPPNIQTQKTISISATTLGSTSAPVTATITLMPAVKINVTPLSAALAAGDAQQFTATVANTSEQGVIWSISPVGIGTITPNGLYVAPPSVLQSQTVTVTAMSVADARQFASATITVTPAATVQPLSVAISPASVTLGGGLSQQFTATVSNASNTAVDWSIKPAGIGTLSSSGSFTAPATVTAQQSVTITATSQADPTKFASAVVTLSPTACASSGYAYQRAIVIDHTKNPNTDQSNFPMLFSTTDPVFASIANGGHVANENGYDIIFSTDPNGVTRLDHELESYNPETGQVVAWVRIPNLSHSSDTTLYVFYGNPNVTAAQANSTGVWDDNYQGVWHFANGSTLSVDDSTVSAYNGSNNGAAAATGLIDGAASFDGSSSYVDVGSMGALPTQGTISFWMNANSLSSYPNVLTTNYNGGNNAIRFEEDGSGDFGVAIGNGPFNGYGYMNASMKPNVWYDVTLTWDTNASRVTGYLNGQQVFNNTTNTLWPATIQDLAIGVGWNTDRIWNGLIDEVRLSDISRSADRVSAEFSSQGAPSNFYSLQPESIFGVIPAEVTLYGAQSQQFAAVQAGSCGTNAVTWSMPDGAPGTLSSSGLYTAPSPIASQQAITITATSQANQSVSATSTVTLMPPVAVSVTPSSATLSENQSELFSAMVTNSSNTAVSWSISPAGMGTIDSFGAYTSPAGLSAPQQVTITAESLQDLTKFGTATVTVTPTQCASATYGYQRVIVIDHTKVGNADLVSFPFLFNTTDQDLASVDFGGHVASSKGYDILFSTDPNGTTRLDYEIEKYNPATGQVVAWIRIPTLSHTTDTVLYVFYGNSNVISTLQNPGGVWNPSYTGVYHFASGQLQDSTRNANNGTPTSISGQAALVDQGIGFTGNSSYFQLPTADFPNYPTGVYDNIDNPDYTPPVTYSSSFGVWFKTPVPGGLLGQVPSISTYCIFFIICGTYPTMPGDYDPASWNAMLYVDDNGKLVGSGLTSTNSYDDNNWHYAVVTHALDGTLTLYADGQVVGSASNQFPTGYSPGYSYFVGTSYTFLGNDGNWDWLYLNGSIDEVKITNAPLSAAWVQSEFNNQGSPSTFYKFYQRTSTQIAPASVSLYALQAQQFAVPGLCDSAVNWSLTSGAPGSLTSTGLYTAPSPIASQQTLAVTATSRANGDNLGTATVTLLPPPPPIVLTASVQPPYQVGSTQSFSATVMDEDGTASTGITVAFAITGSNAAFANVITDDNGVATYSYLGANSGTDKIQATVSLNGQLLASNSINAAWLSPITTPPAAAVTLLTPPSLGVAGLIGAFTDNAGNVIQPVAIGSTARSLPVPTGATQLQLGINSQYYPQDGGAGFTVLVNGVSITVPPTAMPWVWTTGGQNARFQYGIYNSGIQSGVLDGTPPVIAAKNLTAASTVTVAYQSGTASINLPVRPLVDADGDQTWTPGTEIWQGAAFSTQYTTTNAYPVGQPITFDARVLDVTGNPMAGVPVTLSIAGANPQTLQGTTDSTGEAAFLYIGTNPGADSLVAQAFPTGDGVLTSELGSVTWVNRPAPTQAGSLSIAYFGGVNIGQVYNVLAKDSTGAPVKNANLGYYVWGVDNFSQAGTTNVTGYGSFGYNHYTAGTYNLVAVETLNGNTFFSNVITGVWTPPSTTSPCANCSDSINVSISAPKSVTLPASLTLTGAVTDSVGLTPTISWIQISGPGTVTFSAPDQAVTSASFSEPGVYVVQLYATDTNVSASAQFTITVNQAQATGVSQGWIGSPLYGASVSGIVPITVAPGVSLQSGTLTYFPTTDTSNVTVLNANTTGTGQIGALDTTQLLNGSYWIQLHAVDSTGDSQYSLIMVTVTGDYKPGRVTATVTDLVVPSTGVAINIQRTYDSLNAATSSDFGYGWSLGINVNLTVSPAGDVTFTLGGQRKTFYLAPQMPPCTPLVGCLFPYYFVGYRPEPGLFGTLSTAGQACPLDIVVPNGNIWECQDGGQFSPSGYVYTDPRGTSYTISANGSLQSIDDRNGNGLTITPNGITSTTGLSVPFVRDSIGRITQITDTQGNNYQYTYDASGNLATVTYPNVTQPSTYTYDPNHLYLTGTDFRNNPLPSSAYYESSDTDPNGNPLAGKLKSVTNGLGQTTSYAYDLNAHSTTITYPPDAGGAIGKATMVYNSLGDLLTSTDPLGHTTTNVYDAKRNLTSVTDPLGHTTSYTYDPNGNRSSVTYPVTATSTNTTSTTLYNQFSEPISTTDELGNVRTFNYDANYNPQNITDSAGTLASFSFNSAGTLQSGAIGYDINANPTRASQFTYDANGNLTSRIDALGRSTSYTYNYLGQKTSMTVPPLPGTSVDQARTIYTYDALGNLTETDAPLGRTTKSSYDANGNKVSDTDARGNTTTYTYDTLNRLTRTDYPDSTNTKKNYDFRGNIVDEWDQAGNQTHHVYDVAGRQVSVTQAYGTSNATPMTYAYDDAGRKTSETDALGHTTTYVYDAAGKLTGVSGVNGIFTYAYDNARNRVSVTDGKGNTTQYGYDSRKRLVTTTFADGTSKTNTYDGPGNLSSVTDQNGNIVRYSYDAANQLQSVTQTNSPNAPNNVTSYGYNVLGDLTGLNDANSHLTENRFDLLSQPVSKTLPDGSLTETRQYDAAGNLTSLTHFNGKTTTYAYDSLNRLLSRAPDPTTGEPVVSFTYTATGKRHSMTDASGTTDYSYDSIDRVTQKATPEGTLNYTYDAAGHLASMTSSHINGVSASYTYDSLNRLSTVVDGNLTGNQTTTYAYDNANNVATVTYPNGVQYGLNYDELNRLKQIATGQTGYLYTLDAVGNRKSVTELNNRAANWSYDGIYRLTNETISLDPNNKNGSVGYGLDPVGNRTSETSTLSGINSGSFSFNQDDELASESYDSNGNVTAGGGKTFSYNTDNQLVSMSGGAVQILYDGDGNRVKKIVGGVTTQYLVDDLNPSGYAQVVDELTNGAVSRTYTYGLQRIGQNQVVSNAWTPSFYGYDGFGTVRQMTNSTGTITDSYDYDAFGNKINSTGTTPNNYLYRGEQYDPDLGLYYLRARYYNPLTGRFMSRDPEDGRIAKPATLHKYLYAGGDPVNGSDPTGRAELFESAIITGGSALTATEAGILVVGGTAAEVALVIDEIAAGTAEIAELLAEASAAAAEGLTDAAADFLIEAVDVYSELLVKEGLVGAVTRALTCAEVSLLAVQILEEQYHISKDWGHTIEIVGTGACAVRLELLAK
jgi:RHS repeat-associated protein